MEPGIGDFLGQIPAYFFFVPLVLGLIYIGVMVYIFRRAANRRRKQREAQQLQMAQMGIPMGMMPQAAMAGNMYVPMARPAITPLPTVPEPDLADLLSDSLLDAADQMGASPLQDALFNVLDPLPAAVPTTMPTMEAAMPITPLPSQTDEIPADAIEVMRIWRDVSDGSLIVQMGNQHYRSASEIQSPDLLRRFSAVVRELTAMISGTAAPPTGTIRPLPPASPPPYAQAPRPTSSFSFPTSDAPKSSGGVLNRIMGRPAPPPSAPDQPAGIAASVEEFLQARLLGSAEFAQRSIHVRPSLDHGIKIEVDSRYYDSIDEVDDANVREYLFGMMREWEARQ